MPKSSVLALLLLSGSSVFGLTACEREGPAERAGEQVDEAVEEAGEEIEQAGDRARERTDR